MLALFKKREISSTSSLTDVKSTDDHPEARESDSGSLILIEEDVARTRKLLSTETLAMNGRVDEARRRSEEIDRAASTLVEAVGSATATVNALTTSFQAITQAGDEISQEIRHASELAGAAQDDAARVGAGMRDLEEAIAAIEAVVGLIAKVTKQTTLLALNATIEAERAGVVGRGFAVVASEVKALSVETQRATEEIRANIARLQSTARQSVGQVGEVVEAIGRITPTFGVIGRAVEAQGRVIDEAAGHAETTRTFIDTVSERATEIAGTSAAVGREIQDVRDAARQVSTSSEKSFERLIMLLRQSRSGDRRHHDRFPAERTVRVLRGSALETARTIDVSEGGLLLNTSDGVSVQAGETLTLDLDGAGRIRARAVGTSPLGLHVAFDETSADAADRIGRFVAGIRQEYDVLIARAVEAAGSISALLESAVARNEINLGDLFDVDYRPIPGTNPVQYETAALRFLESRLASLQDALLSSDSRMTFCAAVDRNGYLPVHNAAFSKPQRPDDVAWNMANSRNRRIFDDRAGLLAARNTRPFLVQAYPRDMGNGQIIMMREVDAPITVCGRHWGGFRMAYRF